MTWPYRTGNPGAWDDGVTWRPEMVEGPSESVLDLGYVKSAVLRIAHDSDYEDDAIQALIDEVTRTAEDYMDRALIEQTWSMSMDRPPCGRRPIKLPRPPVTAIQSVKYIDESGTLQTWASSNYRLIPASAIHRAQLVLAADVCWPAMACEPDALRVTCECGYDDVSLIPPNFMTGIKLVISELYEIRKLSVQCANTSTPAQLQAERFWRRVVD